MTTASTPVKEDATFAPQISSSPEPGPSTPRQTSIHATTSRDSENALADIEHALHDKRRKSSVIPGVHFGRLAHGHPNGNGNGNGNGGGTIKGKGKGKGKGRKRADTNASDYSNFGDGGRHGSPERIMPSNYKSGTGTDHRNGTGTRSDSKGDGPVVPDITDHNETDEGRELEAEIERLNQEAQEARGRGGPAITFQKNYEPWDEYDPDGEDQYPPREYLWDVLFENQRGLYIFGKAYFSSLSLLPFDPSPYTLPKKRIPAASSHFLISHPDGQSKVPSAESKSTSKERGSIKTAYTPDTFQLPTPAWEWLTPWMINMREGTDEMGWRYNAVFKQKGWSSKAGAGGWWGWVRRREWVRLRCVRPRRSLEDGQAEIEREREKGNGNGSGNGSGTGNGNGSRRKRKSLAEILDVENGDKELWSMVKEIESVSLDREKMEIWDSWLDNLDQETRQRLQAIVDDPDSLRTLKRQFTYRSTSTALEGLLIKHDLQLPKLPTHSPQATPPQSPTISESAADYAEYKSSRDLRPKVK